MRPRGQVRLYYVVACARMKMDVFGREKAVTGANFQHSLRRHGSCKWAASTINGASVILTNTGSKVRVDERKSFQMCDLVLGRILRHLRAR